MNKIKYKIFLSTLILISLTSIVTSAENSSGERLTSLMETDYYSLEKKEKKQFEKDLKSAVKEMPLSDLLLLDESSLDGEALEIFQKELGSKLKKNKVVALLPVEGSEVIIKQVVTVEGDRTQREIFDAAEKWATDAALFRKIGGEQNTFMLLGGQQTHPTMGQLEASMRSRAGVLGSVDGQLLNLRLYQYLQTKGMSIRTLLIETNVTLQFRDGRYRIVMDDMKFDHYNHYMGAQQRFYTGGGCKANGTMFEFQNVCTSADGARRDALIKLQSDRKKFVADLIAGVESNLSGSNLDDW